MGYLSNTSATLTGNLDNSGSLVFYIPPGNSAPASLGVNGSATLSAGSFIGIAEPGIGRRGALKEHFARLGQPDTARGAHEKRRADARF